jgi:dipeptidyl aminopeptidase/acylaminoacyl peptidase
METPKFVASSERPPHYNIQESLEKIPGLSNIKKVTLTSEYLAWVEKKWGTEVSSAIQENLDALDVYTYTYPSDDLSIAGYIWAPKNISEPLPLIVWNRGGAGEYGSTGEKTGTAFLNIACDFAKEGAVVVASEYRGGVGSEGEDEWGGKDVEDVVRLKKITDQLPFRKSGKVIAAGESRGGMMSYLLASQEPWVKGIISLSGTTDLAMSAEDDPEMKEEYIKRFGGGLEEMKKRSATEFYPSIPKDLPILILHGSEDDRVSIAQARKLHELLRASDHDVEYHEFPGGSHGFYGQGEEHRKAALKILHDFLAKNL